MRRIKRWTSWILKPLSSKNWREIAEKLALTVGIIGVLCVLLMAARSSQSQVFVRIEPPSRLQAVDATWLLRVESNQGTQQQSIKLGPVRFWREDQFDPDPFYFDDATRESALFRPQWPKIQRGNGERQVGLTAPLTLNRPTRMLVVVGHPATLSLAPAAKADSKPADTAPSKLLGDSELVEPVELVTSFGFGDRLLLPTYNESTRIDFGWLFIIGKDIRMLSAEEAWKHIGGVAFLVTIGPSGPSPGFGPVWLKMNRGIARLDDAPSDIHPEAVGLLSPMLVVGENYDDLKISIKLGRNGAVKTLGPTRMVDLGVKIGNLISTLSWQEISEEKIPVAQVGLKAGDLIYLRAPDLGFEARDLDFIEVNPVIPRSIPLRFQTIRQK